MKTPAFQFYPADFLADENVALMSNREIGCYIKLMCYCWREGSIPSDINKIARLCGEDGSAMADLWLAIGLCFESAKNDPTRLVHPRLESERSKQSEFKSERSSSGKKGAEARWGKGSKGNGSANGSAIKEPMAKDGSSSSSSSSERELSNDNSSPIPPKTDAAFEQAWGAYPKRNGSNPKQPALVAWRARIKSGFSPGEMLDGVTRYAKWCAATGKTGGEKVMQAKRFFGANAEFLNDWKLPEPWVTTNERPQATDNSVPAKIARAIAERDARQSAGGGYAPDDFIELGSSDYHAVAH